MEIDQSNRRGMKNSACIENARKNIAVVIKIKNIRHSSTVVVFKRTWPAKSPFGSLRIAFSHYQPIPHSRPQFHCRDVGAFSMRVVRRTAGNTHKGPTQLSPVHDRSCLYMSLVSCVNADTGAHGTACSDGAHFAQLGLTGLRSFPGTGDSNYSV